MKKKTVVGLFVLGSLALAGVLTPASAAESPQAVQQEKKADKEQPFHGTVEAVNNTANTITVGGKVINVAADTKLTKTGKAIKLADIKVGDEAHGMTRQAAGGKTEAVTVRIGPEEKQAETPGKKKE